MNEGAKNRLPAFGNFNPIYFLEFIFLRALQISVYCRIGGSHGI